MVDAAAGGSFMRKTPQAAWIILEDMVASSCQYTTDRATIASASTSDDTITNILQLDSITQLSSQIKMLNKNFANIGLVAAANPSRTSQGAKPSEEQGSTEEHMQYLESPDHEEEAVNYVNPQWGDNNNQRSGASYPEPRENHELANSGSSTLRSLKKRKMKRSTSGKGIEAEPESKKSSAPGATKELDISDIELPRSKLVSTSEKRNIVPTKDTSAPAFNSPVQVNPSVQDLTRAERQAP
ncbi:hypothetical protein Dimus_033738, partial [Dionaea muscipula]